MHTTSMLETQRMREKASFSKITRRARRMARAPKKMNSTTKEDFVKKGYKKLARKITPASSTRQQLETQSMASSTTGVLNFCLDNKAVKTFSNANHSCQVSTNNLVQCRGTSSVIDSCLVLPSMICPVQAENRFPMPSQLHGQPSSTLILSAFAMGVAWAKMPGSHLTLPGINCFQPLPLGSL